MIPIQLTIEGLYSYQKRQTIDFKNLTEAGLFGIFGTVGSGKSSILEAISFALYGETERMNSKEKRAYNMMNLKSDKSLIEFEFYNYDNLKYKITRTFKRNSKRFEDVKPVDTVFYQYKNDNYIPLEHTDAEKIIGLSYANFKRTIIIPQGQFKEFLELGASERTKMMKEIFGLQRYDLQDKTAILYSKTKSELDQLQGKLTGFENVSEEKIENLKIELKERLTYETQIQEKFNLINEKFQQLKALKSDFESLQQKKINFETLEKEKPLKEAQEKQLSLYESTFGIFNPLTTELSKINSEIISKKSNIEAQEKDYHNVQKEFQKIIEKLEQLQPQFEKLSQERKIELDLELIAQTLKFNSELKELVAKTEVGLQYVNDHQQTEKKITSLIKALEEEVVSLSKNKLDAATLMKIENWFTVRENLENSKEKTQNKIKEIQSNIETIKEKFFLKNLNFETFEKEFSTQFENLAQNKVHLEKQKNDLHIQQKLAEFSHQLHDGEACPLCGSHEHPHILEIEDVSSKLTQIEKELTKNDDQTKVLRENLDQLKSVKQNLELQIQNLELEKNSIKETENAIKEHLNLFIWKEFNAQDKTTFETKKTTTLELDTIISKKNEDLKSLRENLEKERVTLHNANEKLSKIKRDEIEKSTQISQNKSQLKVLNFADFEEKSEENILEKLDSLRNENNRIEEEYNKLNKDYNTINPRLASINASIQLLKNQEKDLQKNHQQIQEKIDFALSNSKFKNLEEVQNILNQNLDVQKIRRSIEEFKIQYLSLKNSIEELESKLEKISFNENDFQSQEQQFIEINEQLNQAKKLVIETKTEILRLEKEFDSKKQLLQELGTVEKRSENLKTLSNLFKGAGFVQYVSSIYLSQLCDHANERFHRMTRGQLSLQLNENNDFEVKDYLNEGKTRSVKTLSGGQSFQVSLSLALALAESVQNNAKADKNFFFIDEGFGTQDAESINIVFETLQSLQKENRIVGIISHVEELKERIPISLQVTKDEEKGSIIETI